jgi:membrane-bound serine protease (ClpP class)
MSHRKLIPPALLLVLILGLLGATPATLPTAVPEIKDLKNGTAAVITLRGHIDDYTRDALFRNFAAARAAGATTIIIDLDTPGGLVTSSLDIARFIRGQNDLTVIAYVEKAYSGGAMVAVACNQIVMAPSAVVGDCAPIIFKTDGGLDAMPPAERAKAQSPVLADFDASADRNGYDRLLLEAMVITERVVYWVEDPKTHARQFVDQAGYDKLTKQGWISVPGVPCPVDGADTLLTVNTDEAIKLGLAKGIAISPQALADSRHEPVVADLTPGAGEVIIEFLNHPLVRWFAMIGFMFSMYIVLSAPGHGFAEAIAVISLGVLIGVPLLTGHATWWEAVMIFAGLALVAFEIFVFPGHGVSLILGIILVLGGILMTFVGGTPGSPWPHTAQMWSQVRTGSAVILGSLTCSLLLWAWLRSMLPKLPYFNRLILTTNSGDVPTRGAAEVAPENNWPGVGTTGVAVTDLRPGGSAEFPDLGIDDVRTVGVVSESGYVAAGTQLVVRESRGARVVVRAVT